MFTISEKAEKQLVEHSSKNPDKVVRIAVSGGGCHGLKYGLWLEKREKSDSEDIVIEKEGYTIVMDPQTSGILSEAVLEFDDSLLVGELRIHNPRAKSSCGCGSSFSA